MQIVLSDNGPGVRHPEKLFHPFRAGAGHGGSGLGLYLSRAMMLSFHGDLRFQPEAQGATFLVEMLAAEAVEGQAHEPALGASGPHSAGG